MAGSLVAGPKTTILVPGVTFGIEVGSFGYFTVVPDASGGLVVDNGVSATSTPGTLIDDGVSVTRTPGTLTFNTVSADAQGNTERARLMRLRIQGLKDMRAEKR